jgi:hypothetical protein
MVNHKKSCMSSILLCPLTKNAQLPFCLQNLCAAKQDFNLSMERNLCIIIMTAPQWRSQYWFRRISIGELANLLTSKIITLSELFSFVSSTSDQVTAGAFGNHLGCLAKCLQ